MIEYITIKNFRAISESRVEGFTELNIFVGKNNSGKSTLLEALAMLIDPYSLPTIAKRRGWFGLDSISSIFRYRKTENPIEIVGDKYSIEIKKIIPSHDTVEFLIKTHGFKNEILPLKISHRYDSIITELETYFDSDGKFRNFVETEGRLQTNYVIIGL